MHTAWYVYMVRCADNTLYTGITTDLARRVAEHNGQAKTPGAKYTAARRPVQLVYHVACRNRAAAGQKEYQLRRLPRAAKLALVGNSPSR